MSRRAISISIADAGNEQGIALVVVLLSMMLLAALAIALSLTTDTETRIAASYGSNAEAFHAADAAAERAFEELSLINDWNPVLGGAATSTLVDGAAGVRRLSDGSQVDLNEQTDLLNCGHVSCSAADLADITAERPWGSNNPTWTLFAHAPLASFAPPGAIDSKLYVAVWVADDALETDGQPSLDGDQTHGANPGAGVMQLRAESFGPAGARRSIEVTLRRVGAGAQMISWREIRRSP